MSMRKELLIAYFLATLCFCLSACATTSTTVDTSSQEGGNASSGTGADVQENYKEVPFEDVSLRLYWDANTLFSEPEDVYNDNLAVAGLVMAAASNASNADGDMANEVYQDLGFDLVRSVDYNTDSGNIWGDWEAFSPAHTMGIQEITIEGQTKYLIGMTIRGTADAGDGATDILSTFDGGAWSAKNVLNEFNDEFIPLCKEKGHLPEDVEDSQIVMFINGHSLGGGIANVIGQYYVLSHPQTKCFVYSYAPMRTEALDSSNHVLEVSGSIGDNAAPNLIEVINPSDGVPSITLGKISYHVGNVINMEMSDSSLTYYQRLTGYDQPDPLVFFSNEKSHHNVNVYMSLLMTYDADTDWSSRIIGGYGSANISDPAESGEASEVSEDTDATEDAEASNAAINDSSVTDFTLEGTWKSVGEHGFGQAQPGSTVWFDGEHCSYWSPYDTYSCYSNDDGTYTLETTSVIFGDKMTHIVEVEDSDNITITLVEEGSAYYGDSESNTSVLERVE